MVALENIYNTDKATISYYFVLCTFSFLFFSLVCLVGFLAFASKLRSDTDTALRASGDYMAFLHMILLSVFILSLQENFDIRFCKEKCTCTLSV